MPNLFTKDPQAVLDYTWDWSQWLQVGETIVTHLVTVPAGITKDSEVVTATSVTAWLSGGSANQTYTITCHIETSQTPSRKDDRSIKIICQDR